MCPSPICSASWPGSPAPNWLNPTSMTRPCTPFGSPWARSPTDPRRRGGRSPGTGSAQGLAHPHMRDARFHLLGPVRLVTETRVEPCSRCLGVQDDQGEPPVAGPLLHGLDESY